MTDNAREMELVTPVVVTMSFSVKFPFQLYAKRAMYFLSRMFPCGSSYLVPFPGREYIALTSSLLSFAIGNKTSSGIPSEKRVMDESSME